MAATSTRTAPASPPAIQVAGLTKDYGGRRALDGLDLEVPAGCAFGFLGHNGAGKTTTLRLLLGLAEPGGGAMAMLGHLLPGERAAALARIGAMVDEPRFHGHLTGRENLLVNAAARGGRAASRIPAALEEVGLAERAEEPVRGYSQGMRQRLGIARCLVADPELLILDEPMNGLDPGGILWLRDLVRRRVAAGGTVLLSSHLLDEVEKCCDLVAIVDGGRLVTQGTPAALAAGATRRVAIDCDNPRRGRCALDGLAGVRSVAIFEDEVRLELTATAVLAEVVTDAAEQLLAADVAIERLAPIEVSLEERFLELTTP
jgi:ABC-2 type transport system ATP-binding protein